jgi:hypothetical protein
MQARVAELEGLRNEHAAALQSLTDEQKQQLIALQQKVGRRL